MLPSREDKKSKIENLVLSQPLMTGKHSDSLFDSTEFIISTGPWAYEIRPQTSWLPAPQSTLSVALTPPETDVLPKSTEGFAGLSIARVWRLRKKKVGSCPPIPPVRLRVLCRELVRVALPRGKERKSYVPETLGLVCWEEGLLFQGVKLFATEPGMSVHCLARCSRFGTCE